MFNRKFAAVAAALMSSAILTLPAMAAPTGKYTSPSELATKGTFKKYLVLEQNAKVPDSGLEFEFQIAPGTADAPNGVSAGLPGAVIDGSGKATFAKDDDAGAKTDTNASVSGYDSGSQKYIEKDLTVDFSACDFQKPGVYRYVITEQAGSNGAVQNDTDPTRYMDVYVVNNETLNGMKIQSVVLHNEDNYKPSNTDPTGKSIGYTNTYTTNDLTLEKQITGNQADMNEEFAFTVELTAPDGTYPVTLEAGDATLSQSEITVESGTGTWSGNLGDDDKIKIGGLPKGASVNVKEEANGYTATYTVDGAGSTALNSDDGADVEMEDADKAVVVTNNKTGLIPTGVAVAVGPFALLTIAAGLGCVVISKKRRVEE